MRDNPSAQPEASQSPGELQNVLIGTCQAPPFSAVAHSQIKHILCLLSVSVIKTAAIQLADSRIYQTDSQKTICCKVPDPPLCLLCLPPSSYNPNGLLCKIGLCIAPDQGLVCIYSIYCLAVRPFPLPPALASCVLLSLKTYCNLCQSCCKSHPHRVPCLQTGTDQSRRLCLFCLVPC